MIVALLRCSWPSPTWCSGPRSRVRTEPKGNESGRRTPLTSALRGTETAGRGGRSAAETRRDASYTQNKHPTRSVIRTANPSDQSAQLPLLHCAAQSGQQPVGDELKVLSSVSEFLPSLLSYVWSALCWLERLLMARMENEWKGHSLLRSQRSARERQLTVVVS